MLNIKREILKAIDWVVSALLSWLPEDFVLDVCLPDIKPAKKIPLEKKEVKNDSRISTTMNSHGASPKKRLAAERVRSAVRIPESLPSKFKIHLATNDAERIEAFKVLHDSYVAEGLMDEHKSGLRLTKHNLLPTTLTIVVKKHSKIIGTATIIQDSPLGLPIEDTFSISHVRQQSLRNAEISALAIDPAYRGNSALLFALVGYCLRLPFSHLGIERVVIAVNPGHRAFYSGALGFLEDTSTSARPCAGVKSAPGIPMHLGRTQHLAYMNKHFHGRPNSENLYNFIWHTDTPNVIYPARNDYRRYGVFEPKSLDDLFIRRSDLWKKLPERERNMIRSIYFFSEYLKVLGPFTRSDDYFVRAQSRIPVHIKSIVRAQNKKIALPAAICDVSYDGCQVITTMPLQDQEPIELELDVNNTNHRSFCHADIVWTRGCQTGIKISGGHIDHWRTVVGALEDSWRHKDRISNDQLVS